MKRWPRYIVRMKKNQDTEQIHVCSVASVVSDPFRLYGLVAQQAPLSTGSSGKNTGVKTSCTGSAWPRDQTRILYIPAISKWVLYHQRQLGSLKVLTL